MPALLEKEEERNENGRKENSDKEYHTFYPSSYQAPRLIRKNPPKGAGIRLEL
jgi:hypothetical protein